MNTTVTSNIYDNGFLQNVRIFGKTASLTYFQQFTKVDILFAMYETLFNLWSHGVNIQALCDVKLFKYSDTFYEAFCLWRDKIRKKDDSNACVELSKFHA